MNKNLSNVPSAGTKDEQLTTADDSTSASVAASPMLYAAIRDLKLFCQLIKQ